jgi:hypothetical protein
MAVLDGFGALADDRLNDVGRREIEIIAGAIEVDREQEDGVHAVLLPVGLALGQERLFGDAVRGVGFLGITIPKVLLAEGHGGELRVGADGAEDDSLFNGVAARQASMT